MNFTAAKADHLFLLDDYLAGFLHVEEVLGPLDGGAHPTYQKLRRNSELVEANNWVSEVLAVERRRDTSATPWSV